MTTPHSEEFVRIKDNAHTHPSGAGPGFGTPCIWTFLSNLSKKVFPRPVNDRNQLSRHAGLDPESKALAELGKALDPGFRRGDRLWEASILVVQ